MRVVAVQPADIGAWREPLAWHFRSFTADGSMNPETYWQDIASQQRQLWVLENDEAVQAAIITRVADDLHQTCEVTHCAGENRTDWQHLWPAIEHWARAIGCKKIKAICRPGWERILPLKKTHVILEGDL